MCTALSMTDGDHYFGRTLDLHCSYGEEVVVMPRAFPLVYHHAVTQERHYAVIGMAKVTDGYPLYYDGVNEHGLAMAGLNFPGNACYTSPAVGTDNVASFELLPWLLGQCRNVAEAEVCLARLRITDTPFSAEMPPAPLHWMLSDRNRDVVIEATRDGLRIYENPVGVLTNNPPFFHQLARLKDYQHLRVDNATVAREEDLPYSTYSQGMGAVGLPGDVSSTSRFVRAAFARKHSVSGTGENAIVGQFFHVLSAVEMIRGLCKTDEGRWDITVYTACMNTSRGVYYYTTYGNRRINSVDLRHADLGARELLRFPLVTEEEIGYQNI